MKIAEIYRSVQGEGLLTGTPSVFVRTSGCNLRCWYCDTPYSSWQPEGRDLAVDEIVAQVDEWNCGHVVITGGEPMLWSEMIPLCDELAAQRRHLTVETAGTLYLPVTCDLMSISPKLANSAPSSTSHVRWRRRHDRQRQRPDVVRRLMDEYEYQLKFVVDEPADLPEIARYLRVLGPTDPDRILLMPQGTDPQALAERSSWLRPFSQEHGFVYCPRKQIEWFGAARGT